jgi:hypothetical protein
MEHMSSRSISLVRKCAHGYQDVQHITLPSTLKLYEMLLSWPDGDEVLVQMMR